MKPVEIKCACGKVVHKTNQYGGSGTSHCIQCQRWVRWRVDSNGKVTVSMQNHG